MKKKNILISLFLVMNIFGVIGCGSANVDTEISTENKIVAEETEKQTEVIGETETTIEETEKPQLEKVIYKVTVSNKNGTEVNLYDRSSYLEEPPVEQVPNGTEFNALPHPIICREVYNEGENVNFCVVQLEDGTYRYILESNCQKIEEN